MTNYPSPTFQDVHTTTLEASGNVTFGGTLSATGSATFGSTFSVSGNATFGGTLSVTNALSAASAAITGAANVGSLTATGAVNAASGAVTGALSVGSITVGGQAIVISNPNRIVNGDMPNDQRNNGNYGTATNTYTVDRWYHVATQTGVGTWGRNYLLSAPQSFPYFLGYQVTGVGATLSSTDTFQFRQPIEADFVHDFAWGTSGAQSVTLSFWAYSNVTGTFSGAIQNYAQTRSYPFTYTISQVGVWTKISVTIPGDTGGTWVMSGNGGALYVCFDLGSGSSMRGTAGAWASANHVGATGAVSIVTTSFDEFGLTGVKLELGSIPTPFQRLSPNAGILDCYRYHFVGTDVFGGYGATGSPIFETFNLPVPMRTTGITVTASSGSISNLTSAAASPVSNNSIQVSGTVTTTGNYSYNQVLACDAEL